MNRAAKIQAAIDALPHATGGEWWCDHHELLNDPIGSVKIAGYVSGMNPQQAEAHRKLLSAAKDLAEEVVRLRGLVKEAYLDGQRSIQDAIPRSVVPSDPLTFPESVVKEKLNAP